MFPFWFVTQCCFLARHALWCMLSFNISLFVRRAFLPPLLYLITHLTPGFSRILSFFFSLLVFMLFFWLIAECFGLVTQCSREGGGVKWCRSFLLVYHTVLFLLLIYAVVAYYPVPFSLKRSRGKPKNTPLYPSFHCLQTVKND